MPYSKYRSRPVKRRKGVTKRAVASVVRRVVNSNLEHKWNLATMVNGAAVPATWTFLSALTGVTQGTTATTRLGDKIRVQRIEYLVKIEPIAAAAMATGSLCRFCLYHNKQANGSLPAATAVFDVDAFQVMRNVPRQSTISLQRQFIHRMNIIAVDTGGAVRSSGPVFFSSISVYPKKVIEFVNNTGDVAGLLKDDYGICYIGDDANCCAITVTRKLHFTDA